MRKYDVLKAAYETMGGASAAELSKRLNIAIPNTYAYLNELIAEGLIQKNPDGKYAANSTNMKMGHILELQSMSQSKFHIMISPKFGTALGKMCYKTATAGDNFTLAERRTIEKTAIPSRIALKLSKRPLRYCLKINEAITNALLGYHDLRCNFSMEEFDKTVEMAGVPKAQGATKPAQSDQRIIQLCDEYYSKAEDISIMARAKEFVLDANLAELLKNSERADKEYKLFLNALPENVRANILQQWEQKYVYNTNRIEGNTMSEKQVEEFIKTGKEIAGISKRELYETSNMRHALNFLKLKQNREVDDELIQNLHFLVQNDIDGTAGEYKNFYNYVKPLNPTTPPQHVKERIRMLLDWYKQAKGTMHPFQLASVFHMEFEMIHPFADGNGRVGRLLMNHILVQNGCQPLTILEKTKQNYYRALENRSLPQFMLYTLTAFIEEYRR